MTDGETFHDLGAAHRYMRCCDGSGDSYVVEFIKLESGVVLRAHEGPGFDVLAHEAERVRLRDQSRLKWGADMYCRADQIAAISVLPL